MPVVWVLAAIRAGGRRSCRLKHVTPQESQGVSALTGLLL